MNGTQKIRKALVENKLMTEGEANAARIWKGWAVGTQRNGWHVQPFGRTEWFAGQTICDALDTISARAEVY